MKGHPVQVQRLEDVYKRQGKLFNYTTTPNSPGINNIIEDHAGTIWVTRYRVNDGKGSLCQVEADKLRCYGEKDGNPGKYCLLYTSRCV